MKILKYAFNRIHQGKSNYNLARACLLLLSLVIFAGHKFLPEKKLEVYPAAETSLESYGYINPHSGKSYSWVDDSMSAVRCEYKTKNQTGCGLTVRYATKPQLGLDLRGYSRISILLNYEGPSKHLRIYLRNFDERYSSLGDENSTKLLSTLLATEDIATDPISIALDEFSVAERWVTQKNKRRRHSEYEIDNVTNFGIDFMDPGVHLARINNITLAGPLINSERLLIYLILFWAALMIGEGVVKIFSMYQKLQSDKTTISTLRKSQQSLEKEREKLRALSTTDPLTGILNRSGVTQKFHSNLMKNEELANTGILLIDADHFKNINDKFGHDVGDQALKHLANTISRHKRVEDIFGRWGGEEFIVIATEISKENLVILSEKLRRLIEDHNIPLQPPLSITVSVGATILQNGDTFEIAFKRADSALYQAKRNGRNSSCYV